MFKYKGTGHCKSFKKNAVTTALKTPSVVVSWHFRNPCSLKYAQWSAYSEYLSADPGKEWACQIRVSYETCQLNELRVGCKAEFGKHLRISCKTSFTSADVCCSIGMLRHWEKLSVCLPVLGLLRWDRLVLSGADADVQLTENRTGPKLLWKDHLQRQSYHTWLSAASSCGMC